METIKELVKSGVTWTKAGKPPGEPERPTTAAPVAAPEPAKIKEQAKATYEKLFGQELPAEAAPPVTADPAAPPPAPPAPAPAPEPQSEPVTEPTPLTAAVIRDAVRDGVRDATPAPAPAPEPVTVELQPADLADYRALIYMGQNDAAMKGKAEAFLVYCRKLYAYEAQWIKDHPDQEFDHTAGEHTAWYDANEPADLPERDTLIEARAEMKAEEKFRQKMEPVIKQQQADRAYEQAIPAITQNVNRRVLKFVQQAEPELAKHLVDDKGQPLLDDAHVAKLDEANPIASDVLNRIAQVELIPVLAELEKVAVEGMDYRLAPRSNPIHAEIQRYHLQAEKEILAAPASDQIFNGKQFTSVAEMQRLRQEIEQSHRSPDQRAEALRQLEAARCTLGLDDLEEIIVEDKARKAKAQIEKNDRLAKKKYGGNGHVPPVPVPTHAPAAVAAPPVMTAPSTASGRPPSMSSAADVVTAPKPAGGGTKTPAEVITERLFAR